MGKSLQKRLREKQPTDKLQQKLDALLNKSKAVIEQRDSLIPQVIEYDQRLPIVQEKARIAQLIKDNQLVVVAGETGSGKTTQLPKLCLELGLGRVGKIGHTQPRRVAATSVARRIAEELKSPLGTVAGYSVRFNDKTENSTAIRVMTDGILLNEMSRDPLLLDYETLIIDEAHERSLNIDFILGYLKQLLPKRSDLKVIITSATIDLERFSKHFNNAPVIEVSGRTFPVDVWYRPADEEFPLPQVEQIGQAVEEIQHVGTGDILVFLSGEAEIHETAKFLRKAVFQGCEVLPLYARLSIGEQEKIFKPKGGKRRIILATNVAETSVTVPGIRFVIDPGFARMSRYSIRQKIQRLPIEKVSQASANQRKGRCGRVSEGICIRLYSEEDFDLRPEFTDAEILRTNLAAVILQMKQLKLGDIEQFPFIDAPSSKQVSDGLNLLSELQALDGQKNLTNVGYGMSKLPIEPRLARILLSGQEQGCLQECLIIAAFLSVKDPRERPFDKKERANQLHSQYQHSQSDFISILLLWKFLHDKAAEMSNSVFKRHCQEHLINANAFREWKSTYRQLKGLMTKEPLKSAAQWDGEDAAFYKTLHSSLLSGLLSYVGQKDLEKGYMGARNSKFMVHPQSSNFKKQPQWLMAFEIVETSQTYARLTAFIEPQWLEVCAKHLLKTHYFDAHWSKKRGSSVASMQVTLLGLKIVAGRSVDYSEVDKKLSRQLFILHGLVRHELDSHHAFFVNNLKVIADVEHEIAKSRQADLRADERDVAQWFEQRLPEHIVNIKSLNRWLKKDDARNALLSFDKKQLLKPIEQDASQFPEFIEIKGVKLALSYHFEPGAKEDGVTVKIPQSLIKQFSENDFERLVPGLLEEKIEQMLRSLPKRFRKSFVPIPEFAKACYEQVLTQKGSLIDIISKHLFKMTGTILPSEAWQELSLAEHYLMRFEIVNPKGKIVSSSRHIDQATAIKPQLSTPTKATTAKQQYFSQWPQNFSESGAVKESGTKIPVFYALEDCKNQVRLIHLYSQDNADKVHLRGVCRLVTLACTDKIKYLKKSYHNKQRLALACASLCQTDDLVEDAVLAVIKKLALSVAKKISTQQQFEQVVQQVKENLILEANEFLDTVLSGLQLRSSGLSQAQSMKRQLKSSYESVKEQLETLFCKGFCYRYGTEAIQNYKRLLAAIPKRLEKAQSSPLKEAQSTQEFHEWWEIYREFADNDKIPQATADEFLWMLEEYRISLFAQGVKTRFPISAKRLQNFIDVVDKEFG